MEYICNHMSFWRCHKMTKYIVEKITKVVGYKIIPKSKTSDKIQT